MVVPTNVTSKRDINEPLAWIVEGDSVDDPTLYGVTPATSTFLIVDNCIEINPGIDIVHEDILSFGKQQPVDAIKLKEDYTFGFKFNPADTELFPFIWDDTEQEGTGGVGSPDESISFHWSEFIDAVAYHFNVTGWRPTNMNISLEMGLWQVEMIGVCKEITRMNTTDPNTTPTYPAVGSDAVALEHSSAGVSPFSYDSFAYAERRFSLNVTRGMAIQAVNGNQQIQYAKPTSKDVSFSVDAFTGTNAADPTELAADYYGKVDTKEAAYKFSLTPAKTFNFTNCVITSYEKALALGSTDASIESVTMRCESTVDL